MSASNARKEGGGGGGGREEDVTPRESRETGKPVLLHACLKNVDNPRTKICFSDSNYRKSKGALLCEKTKISFLLRHLEHFGRLLKKKKKKKDKLVHKPESEPCLSYANLSPLPLHCHTEKLNYIIF